MESEPEHRRQLLTLASHAFRLQDVTTYLSTPERETVRRLLVPALAALVVGLAGCSEKSPGTGLPDETTGEATATSAPSSTGTGGDSPLADVAPCDLLTTKGAAALKAGAGVEERIGEARVCRWRIEGATLKESFTLDLALYDERGIGDVQGTKITRKTIGSHDAVTFIDPTGLCAVSIAAGDSARADALATGGDEQLGCRLAAQLADLVEPQLP